MKLLITGSKELLASDLKTFFDQRGYQTFLQPILTEDVPDCDAIISLPQKIILKGRLKTKAYEKEFEETRLKPTRALAEKIKLSSNPPKVWISFSSVGIYPKEEAKFYKEKDEPGSDPTAQLIRQWEEATQLPKECPTRVVLPRLGLMISRKSGLLNKVLPFFKMGLGSVMGSGYEAFPWIYQKDLYWFLDYALNQEHMQGVYNTVAPQLINSKDFFKALSSVMRKPLLLKFPKSFYLKRLGDAAEIVLARSMVFPSRLLKSGFEFRYPAIYPSLVDALSKGSHLIS